MRKRIKEAIGKALQSASGYEQIDFRSGFAPGMNEGGFALPCAWLCPLELMERTGRSEGWETYAGVMYLIEDITGLDADGKDEAWDRMQAAVVRVLGSAVEAGEIHAVENIRCAPDEYALTGFNTISVYVRFNVKMKHCGGK